MFCAFSVSPWWCNGYALLSAVMFAKHWIGTSWSIFKVSWLKPSVVWFVQKHLSSKLSFQSGLWLSGLVMFCGEKRNIGFSQSSVICGSHSDNNRLLINPSTYHTSSHLWVFTHTIRSAYSVHLVLSPHLQLSIFKSKNQCLPTS